jgi:hypothetical protein
MIPDDIDADHGPEIRKIEETVMDENKKVEDEAGELIERMTEEQKKYKATTGWPPV